MKTRKLLFKICLFGLLILMAGYGCKKTVIKAKKIDGKWKVSEWNWTLSSDVQTNMTYSGTSCPSAGNTEVKDNNVLTFDGTTFNYNLDHKQYGDGALDSANSYTSKNDMALTETVTINDDGTYKVELVYSYTDYQDNNYSGNVTTDKQNWYLANSNKKNTTITFENFPILNFQTFALGTIRYRDQTWNTDQENTDKDNLVFLLDMNVTGSRTEAEEFSQTCDQKTVITSSVDTTGDIKLERQ